MASLLIGPANRDPDYGREERDYAYIVGAQTAVLATGAGHLHSVVVGVAGALAKFYDTAPGGTADATTQIATVSCAAVSTGAMVFDIAFSAGLTCVVTGAAELTVSYQGRTAPRRIIR